MDTDSRVAKAGEGKVQGGGGQWGKKTTKRTCIIFPTIKTN